jgi:hypothetical protein
MGQPVTRDDVLDQIRAMSLEDREYIEAALLQEAFDAGRHTEAPSEVDELVRRATVALASAGPALSRDESIARAQAVVAAVRTRR